MVCEGRDPVPYLIVFSLHLRQSSQVVQWERIYLPALQTQETQSFDLWIRKIPWRRKWQPTPVFLPEKFHGQRSLAGYSPWGHKDSDTTECAHTLKTMVSTSEVLEKELLILFIHWILNHRCHELALRSHKTLPTKKAHWPAREDKKSENCS